MEDPRRAQLKAMFSRLAGDDGEVDAEELQDILTTTLTKNMGDSVFALDACRAMISMLDVSLTTHRHNYSGTNSTFFGRVFIHFGVFRLDSLVSWG